ncbi:MAG: glutathione S-transferase family protein [Rhizomicrobium sp.]|jgi:glutathione S-transferase
MPILHQMQMSGNCYKVRLAARQLSVPITLKDYPLHDGTTRKPPFLKLNPNGKVPVLEFEDGRILPESGAILFHLSEGSGLQPNNAWDRAQMLQWMFFEQYSHEPYVAVARYWLSFAKPEDFEKKRHLVPEWHAKGNAALSVMESHLSSHDWFAGNGYSIADIALYAYTHSAADGGFDLGGFPRVSAWIARVAAQPGHIPLAERW